MIGKFTLVILLDQITKALFASRDFFFGPIRFHLVKNFGLSFGLNSASRNVSLFVVLLAFAIFGIYFLLDKKANLRSRIGFGIVLAGAISNLLDRIALGYVRDFIDVGMFTFNLADLAIAIGLLLMLIKLSPRTYSEGIGD